MARPVTIGGELAKEYLGTHKGMATRTLARLMRADHPKIYSSIDKARDALRYYQGRHGVKAREVMTDRRFQLPAPTAENPLSLPDSDEIPWIPYVLPDSLASILVLSDIHFPYQHNPSLQAALLYGKAREADCIVLNGDTMDCYGLSSFVRDPEKRDFRGELEVTRHGLMAIRNLFPNARIVYKEGNHEARFANLLQTKAAEFYGLEEMRLEVLLGLFDMGIDYVCDKRPITYRELTILHGHETGATSGGVNPARTALLKAKTCVMVGHFHRKQGDMQRVLGGAWLQAWSTGCLCELHPQYMPINEWVRGFAHVNGGENWTVDNKAIINGVVV